MGWLDDLGNVAIGGLSGALSGGGFAGGLAGAISGALQKKPLTLGSGLGTALTGAGAGLIGKGVGKGISGLLKGPSAANQAVPYTGAIEGPPLPPKGIGDRTLDAISGFGRGALDRLGGVFAPNAQGQGIGDRLLNALPTGGGVVNALRGAQRTASGLGGGATGTPGNPEVVGQTPSGAIPVGGVPGQVQGRSGLQDLSVLAGLGLGAYGLVDKPDRPDLDSVLAGQPAQTQGMIASQIAEQNALRQAAEERFVQDRASGQANLESILGSGTNQAMQDAIRARQSQLNAQGLLGGPSGALNEALAQESGRIRSANIPLLANYATQTQDRLASMRGAGLDSVLGLQNAGLERQFGLSDIRTSTNLRQQLLDIERKRRQQQALLGAAGTAVGYGLGGRGGAQAGADVGRSLEAVLGR